MDRTLESLLPKASVRTPIQRIAAPEEVAGFVSYLASDSAGFITGKVDFFLNRHIYSPGSVVRTREGQCVCLLSSASCRGPSDITIDVHRWWSHS